MAQQRLIQKPPARSGQAAVLRRLNRTFLISLILLYYDSMFYNALY